MKNKTLMEFKEYYYDLKDSNGNWREEPIEILSRANVSEEIIRNLKKIINIIMNSDNISIDTKVFISNYSINLRQVNDEVNRIRRITSDEDKKVFRKLSYNSTTLRVDKDNRELNDIFGNNLKDYIYGNSVDIDKYIKKLIIKVGNFENSRSKLGLNIRTDICKCNEFKNDSTDFFEVLKDIEVYLLSRKYLIESAINNNSEFVEYFNYLLSKEAIVDNEIAVDRERLLKFLNNEDYITGYENE